MRNQLAFGEFHHAFVARREGRKITDVDTTRIETITRKKNSGLPIIKRNADWVVARDGQYINHPITEVYRSGCLWPICHAVELLGRLNGCRDEDDRHRRILDSL